MVPTYQYACTECGEQLEVVQKFTDAALTECPSCDGRLRKVFSAVGVVFKGSGFYRTDSRAAANGSATGSGKSKAAEKASANGSGAAESASSSGSSGAESTSSSSSSNGGSGTSKPSAASSPAA